MVVNYQLCSESFLARALVPGSTSFVPKKEEKDPRSCRNQLSLLLKF